MSELAQQNPSKSGVDIIELGGFCWGRFILFFRSVGEREGNTRARGETFYSGFRDPRDTVEI